ncbi:MAG: hypothetical protein KA436_03630 [Oligoflexales bacterium]|nr:hypothetical protein [Oligoflexales bacterium]
MKIQFQEKDPEKVVHKIQESLGGRQLGSLLNFNLKDKNVTVKIQKFGTSTLEFSHNPAVKESLEWVLSSEKIAFAHKAFKEEVLSKLKKVIEDLGGMVS